MISRPNNGPDSLLSESGITAHLPFDAGIARADCVDP
jgi:hypothetical protein